MKSGIPIALRRTVGIVVGGWLLAMGCLCFVSSFYMPNCFTGLPDLVYHLTAFWVSCVPWGLSAVVFYHVYKMD